MARSAVSTYHPEFFYGSAYERCSDIQSTNDYYPFGSALPGRGFDEGSYKFGFNGKENDDEVYGDGNFQDYGMRMYDNRVGRFVSVDPLTKKYPELTPYQFASNTPIWAIDMDGLEKLTYTVLGYLNDGRATVRVQRDPGSTSRTSNKRNISIRNATPGASNSIARTFSSSLMNQVFGIDPNNLGQSNSHVVEASPFRGTPANGQTEYYFYLAATDLQSTGINVVSGECFANSTFAYNSTQPGDYTVENVTLSVPPTPAPVSGLSTNISPPNAGGTVENFSTSTINIINNAANQTGQTPNQIKAININYPGYQAYTNEMSAIVQQTQQIYPNAAISFQSVPIDRTGNISTSVQVTGSTTPFK